MTGKTHRVGGMLGALAGYTILEQKGLLISNVDPIAQLVVMYPFAIYGSVFSDLDHHWQSAPSKDIFSFIINKVLHLTTGIRKRKGKINPALRVFDAQHRSWQTHSDLFLLLICLVSYQVMGIWDGTATGLICRLISMGFLIGVISHLVLDSITPEGIWSVLLVITGKVTGIKKIPKKIHFVPKTEFFATGGKWEDLVRQIMWVVCFMLLVRILLYYFPYSISFT